VVSVVHAWVCLLHASVVVVLIQFVLLVWIFNLETSHRDELRIRGTSCPGRSHSLRPHSTLCFNFSIPSQHGIFVLEFDDKIFNSRITFPKNLDGVVTYLNFSHKNTVFRIRICLPGPDAVKTCVTFAKNIRPLSCNRGWPLAVTESFSLLPIYFDFCLLRLMSLQQSNILSKR
jgi:hypothetical protein